MLSYWLQTETHRPERKSSMVRREYLNKSWSRSERRLNDISDSDVQREPDPDYTPRLRRKVNFQILSLLSLVKVVESKFKRVTSFPRPLPISGLLAVNSVTSEGRNYRDSRVRRGGGSLPSRLPASKYSCRVILKKSPKSCY